MSLNSHVILLPRQGENRIAIVMCDSRGSNNEAMNQIVKAVTKWVEETDEGQIALARSSTDFNVADLENIVEWHDAELDSFLPFLEEFEVYNLTIKLYGDEDYPVNYTYDTVLVEGL